MSPTDLRFQQTRGTTGDLVFGESDTALTLASATIRGAFPALRVAVRVVTVERVTIRGAFALLTGRVSAAYRSNTQRPTVGQTVHAWQGTRHAEAGTAWGQQDASGAPVGWAASWERGARAYAGIEHRLPGTLCRMLIDRSVRQRDGSGLGASMGAAHQEATRVWQERVGIFQGADSRHNGTRFRHQDGDRTSRVSRASAWQVSTRHRRSNGSAFQVATPFSQAWHGRFQEARVPPIGVSVVRPPEPPVPSPCYTPSGHLVFALPGRADAHLVFVCDASPVPPGTTVVVPVRRVYLVLNDVSLHRLIDGVEVPVWTLSLSLDAGSWTWGFDAVLPAIAEPLVDPGRAAAPVELVVRVNGTTFRVLAEGIRRERRFGEASIRVSGRGRNAVLAAPYAPVMTFSNAEARTARQLMDDVLTLNGVSLGWTVDWNLTDWIVPARVFAYQGTWIEALAAIAGAAGGDLLPHPTDQSLRVRHRYPVAPWEWHTVTPDFVLPVEAVARESVRWLEKPAYNRVFVAGQEVGVLGQVTRAGTAGEVLAPMVVDPLITEVAAARERGLSVLADTGRQIEVSLRLPVWAATGIIEPGAFVEYQDGSVTRLGMVRATHVEAGLPEVWQTLGVQAYA
ncbi:MAG TPA: hypothetical protein PK752_00380 [Accumulibacter sp.]|uniref:hypothetical protein n=1 Tax=Accumulibacter sp. TaxID=2053492 RepID=UPI002BF32405|nr:hypothetical protein [Accumulibacter sp.]HRD86703.1 hypothetical protein [Accumulibacter sp.]